MARARDSPKRIGAEYQAAEYGCLFCGQKGEARMKNVRWKRMIAGILAAAICMMNCGLPAAASEPGVTGETITEAEQYACQSKFVHDVFLSSLS